MKIFYRILLLALIVIGCSSNDPQKIIDKAIGAAGGEKYLHATIEFDFRGRHYIAQREGGKYSYQRIFKDTKDSTNIVHDFVTNEGFIRKINDSVVTVPDSMKVKYTSSINSVIYFALLPYGLNDGSVKKKFLGETILDNQSFYKIEITFGQEGGGEDFEDTFNYWINQSDFTIGYLSYSFSEDNKIDYRLRKAYHQQRVNGILFQDFINYQPKRNSEVKLEDMELLYKRNELEELSKIENTTISVR